MAQLVVGAPNQSCGEAQAVNTAAGQLCTHGDDSQFAPGGSQAEAGGHLDAADTLVAAGTAATSGTPAARAIPCHRDGTSGNRLAIYYAYLAGQPNRSAQFRKSITTAIQQANDIVYQSAQQTGGSRWLKVLTDSACNPAIGTIQLPVSAANDFGTTVSAAFAAKLSASNRKYVLFVDTNHYCGLGGLTFDDQAGPMNANNVGPSWARLDRNCWTGPIAAHEIFHMLGAVQKTAPHYDNTGHCTDDRDVMCYQNTGGKKNYTLCSSKIDALRLDCSKDDYFNAAHRVTNYLATHWNTASSSFLYGGGPAQPTKPGVVRSPNATMTSLGTAVVSWNAPVGSPATAYVVTKDGSAVWRGAGTQWTDTTATAGQSTYAIQASNVAGSGPWSAAVTATLPAPSAAADVRSSGSSPTSITWTRKSSALVAGQRLYGLSSSGALTDLGTPSADARSASDSTWALFKSWSRYRVCAYNDTGETCTDSP